MLVKIEEIQEPGLELRSPIAPTVLAEALADAGGWSLVKASVLEASFTKVSGQVHLKGRFEAQLSGPCKRCLAPVEVAVPVAFSLRMVRELPKADDDEDDAAGSKRHRRDDDEAEGSFDLDEVDAEPFDGKTIDLAPVVREQLLLALPATLLCRDDCKGLCTTCGQELNVLDCGHGRVREVDPRLSKLASIKLKH